MSDNEYLRAGVTWVVVADEGAAAVYERAQSSGKLEPAGQVKQSAGGELTNEFVSRLAGYLDDAERAGRFEQLVVAASPLMLGALRAQLGESARRRITAELNKNITSTDPERLAVLIDDD